MRRLHDAFQRSRARCPARVPGSPPARQPARKRRAAAASCWPPSRPTHRASIRTRSSTFATIQLVAPLYSTLIQIDPVQLPEDHRRRGQRVEDRARRAHLHVQDPAGDPVPRRLGADGRRRQGHATTRSSSRRRACEASGRTPTPRSASVEAPDPSHRGLQAQVPVGVAPRQPRVAVERHLSRRSTWTRTRTTSRPTSSGSGPFKFKSYTRGSTFEGERNPDYFVKDRPYLDGYKFFISPETSVRAAAHPLRARLHRVPHLPLRGGGGDHEAARRQGRRPGHARDRPVRDRDEPDREAVHRHPRPQGPHAGHRSLHGGPGPVSDRRVSRTSGA